MKALILYLDMTIWIAMYPYVLEDRLKYAVKMNKRLLELHHDI